MSNVARPTPGKVELAAVVFANVVLAVLWAAGVGLVVLYEAFAAEARLESLGWAMRTMPALGLLIAVGLAIWQLRDRSTWAPFATTIVFAVVSKIVAARYVGVLAILFLIIVGS